MHAEERPSGQRPGGGPQHARAADPALERWAPGQAQRPIQTPAHDRRIQGDQCGRRQRQCPPVLAGGGARAQRQRHRRHQQPGGQGDQHRHHGRRRGTPPRHLVRARHLDLCRHRPYGTGHVLAKLRDEQDPGGGAQRQRGAKVGQQRPPGQHHAAQPGNDRHGRAGHRVPGKALQRRGHVAPLGVQPVGAEAKRDGEEPELDPSARRQVADHARQPSGSRRGGAGRHARQRAGRVSRRAGRGPPAPARRAGRPAAGAGTARSPTGCPRR